MIVGDGDIASVLVDREGFIFFASGVSNSKETRDSEYRRELDLLLAQDKTKHLVYFSSLSIFYTNNRYTEHKELAEDLVKRKFPHYTIIRLGNISWGKNPNTIINYLRAHPDAELQDVYRYVIDKNEFLDWIRMIPNWNCEMNLPGRRMKVKEIYERYVNT